MPNLKPEYRAQVQSFIQAMDYTNNVSEDSDFKMSKIKDEAFDRFREVDMPNTWIALNPHIKGFKNDFIVPQRFWDFENSYAARIQKRFAEPAPVVELVEEKKPNRPKMNM